MPPAASHRVLTVSDAGSLRFGVASLVTVPMSRLAERARRVEDLGFDYFWVPDERLYRSAYISLAVIAGATERIQIGPAVTNPYTRTPAMTAATIATLDEMSGGRTILGVGAGGALEVHGLERTAPVRRIRELVETVRALTGGGTVRYPGGQAQDVSLDFAAPRTTPVFIAARGASTLALAGEIADGAIIGGFAQPAGIAYAKGRIEEGLARAGRTWEAIHTVAWIFISVDDDSSRARAAVERMVLAAIVSSRPILDQLGIRLADELVAGLDATDWAYPTDASVAAKLLDDDTVSAFSVSGTPDECVDQLKFLREAGVDQVSFVIMPPQGSSVDDVIELIAAEVIPRLGA